MRLRAPWYAPRVVRPALALLAALALAACADRPPNLVLVIGDDHGWRDYGFMGSETVQTPRLDALAAQGTVYPRAFNTASSCRPALRSLLSGLHPVAWRARARVLEGRAALGEPGRPAPATDLELVRELETLPRVLARRGYASFQGGKHWEGSFADAGFTHGLTPGRPRTAKLRDLSGGEAALALGRETMEPLWRFLDAHREEPFFVWFAPSLPHRPHDAGPAYAERYADAGLTPAARAYYANITRFDARLGELLDRLDALGISEETVVVYLSDNGWEQDPAAGLESFSGGPHGKHSLYEPGFRTPLVVRWPGRVAAGAVRRDLVSSVDVYATLLDLAGVETPPGRTGHSLGPPLMQGAPWPRDRVFGGMQQLQPPGGGWPEPSQGWFLRTDAWRYLWFEDRGAEELYAVERDPGETTDLAGRHPARLAAFREQVVEWRARVTRLAEGLEGRAPADRP